MLSRLSWLLSLLILLISPACADAFMFDVWKSGMKIKSVIEAGKERGASVELASGGFSFFGKREPEELAVKVECHSKTKLMGYDANILFTFTPESRLLHSLRVTLSLPFSSEKADMEVLADAIAKQLTAKYKEHGEQSADSLLGQLVDKVRDIRRRVWQGGGDTVTMESNWEMMRGEVVLLYVDEKLAEKAGIEDRRIREKRLERSSGGDRDKF